MDLPRLAAFGLTSLFLFGCAEQNQLGPDVTSPDLNGMQSASELHQQDERNNVIRISGAVHHPGNFSLAPGQTFTLSQALSLTKGTIAPTAFDNGAALNSIRVSRLQNGSVAIIKLDIRPGHDGGNFVIKSGDEIFVPEVVFDY